jgi:hypothetical protein
MKQVTMTAKEFRARRCGAKVPGGKYHVADKADRTADGIVFASKKEMNRYLELRMLQKVGAVAFFLRQVPFHLPGKTKYLADFLVVWNQFRFGLNNPMHYPWWKERMSIEDTKGCRTEVYRLKKRQVEELYPVKIREL